jgi:hypothetical protein
VSDVVVLGGRTYQIHLTENELCTGKAIVGLVSGETISSKTPLLLGQYYAGQYLVNLESELGSRIKSISGSGSQIDLEDSAVGFNADNTFSIYDFGPGDQFTIASNVFIVAETGGSYKIVSNVVGTLVVAGVVQNFGPGA